MSNPRDRRLENDFRSLQQLSQNSDFISVLPMGVMAGRPPEKYRVTFTCKGIVGINRDESPIYGEHHEVDIQLTGEYPNRPPKFTWRTPIWHPNIHSGPPHQVCIDQAHWQVGQTLSQIVLMLGEMVQYKNYHAKNTPPYPLDTVVAKWARMAETRGWFSLTPYKPVDPRPLERPDHTAAQPARRPRITVRPSGSGATATARPARPTGPSALAAPIAPPGRIRFSSRDQA